MKKILNDPVWDFELSLFRISIFGFRISMILSVIAFVLVVMGGAQAQQSGKISRIGFLTAVSASSFASRTDAFRKGLRELGYIEGKNIVIEYRYGDGKTDRMNQLA